MKLSTLLREWQVFYEAMKNGRRNMAYYQEWRSNGSRMQKEHGNVFITEKTWQCTYKTRSLGLTRMAK